jgi:hypothetical protein
MQSFKCLVKSCPALALVDETVLREWLLVVVFPCCQIWVGVRLDVSTDFTSANYPMEDR